jgi:flagellar biosynthesis protein FlhF
MRDALQQIRSELGVDAVILGTRPLGTGVEVSAAVDAEHLQAAQASLPPQIPAQTAAEPDFGLQLLTAAEASHDSASKVAEQQAMSDELRNLRQLLERQLAALAWNDYTRREPLRARALTDLTELGLGRDVALSVLGELPATLGNEQSQRLHYGLLARRIATGESPLVAGGAVALIGAAGSGRTTMMAKLALRWLLERGGDSLALVTIDDEHIGSVEQARSLGRLLGVPSYRFADAEDFAAASRRIAGHELVLIDTPALGAAEAAVQSLAAGLRAALPQLRSMLILPASTQAGVLDESVRRARPYAPDCCAVTRCDEAVSLGGVLSTLVRTRLPVALLSDGPRIPDDLRPARAHQLVARAAELARLAHAHADEDLLAQRFGGEVNAAA